MTRSPIIALEGVTKRFGAGTGAAAVDAVSLTIEEGEFFALLGPSGCGKTTLLRLLAGLETPDAGRILIDGQDMSGTPANRRPLNMVFQSYALFPHMSVAENVAFGLRVEGVKGPERRERVAQALALVQLEDLASRRPDQLSGGQKQRVALARALVKRPRVVLLDEPLSALDAKLRETMRAELAQLQRRVGATFVFVTHDQEEALAMASRCAVMRAGRLEQVAAPVELYDAPASRFVAEFIGQVNLIPARAERGDDGETRLTAPDLGLVLPAPPGLASAAPVWIAVRPEQVSLAASEAPLGAETEVSVAAVVEQVQFLGGVSIISARTCSGFVLKASRAHAGIGAPAFAVGTPVTLSWPRAAMRGVSEHG